MSDIAVFTMGTRGDVQPYIYLARALTRAKHNVVIGTHPAICVTQRSQMRLPAATRRKKRPPNNGLNLKLISTSENVKNKRCARHS
ncbi:MAG: glycosyltransferase [Lachnospiraceae bacterium]|nr:glycosyltransferase [Lachnospiraceae bacterium]